MSTVLRSPAEQARVVEAPPTVGLDEGVEAPAQRLQRADGGRPLDGRHGVSVRVGWVLTVA